MSLKPKKSKYLSKKLDQNGIAHYTDQENETWNILYQRQMETIQDRACDEFLEGIALLGMSKDRIPQCPDISKTLQQTTGWSVAPVPSLISSQRFFTLLANRQFPAATFIRIPEELDYLQEPDIFHEIYGHCPLLTNKDYADFVETYGKLSLEVSPNIQNRLLRLFWMTIEFGLMETPKGTRIYGGGILSSYEETIYALGSPIPERKPFTILDALRTPYRIDIKQPVYYILPSMHTLYDILHSDLFAYVEEAVELGDFNVNFSKK